MSFRLDWTTISISEMNILGSDRNLILNNTELNNLHDFS